MCVHIDEENNECRIMPSAVTDIPMKALAMVIFSHILSRTSRPDSGQAMALATVAMSLWMERWKSSNPGKDQRTHVQVNTRTEPRALFRSWSSSGRISVESVWDICVWHHWTSLNDKEMNLPQISKMMKHVLFPKDYWNSWVLLPQIILGFLWFGL